MYSTVALDENNDIYLDSQGNLAMLYGTPAVLQVCQNAAKTVLGEMRYASNKGLPVFQVVFNGVPNVGQFESALRETLLAIPGVLGISYLTTQIVENKLSYFVGIVTSDSDTQGSQITGTLNV
jgi:hypothetical protein